MDFLKSIVPLVDNARFERDLPDSGQLKLLYDLIRSGKILQEDEGRQKIYGENGSVLAFKKLKQRLRDRLTEHVIMNGVAYKNLDDYARMYRKCMTQVLAVKTLSLSNARVAATSIAENLIKTTQSNEYTDLTLLVARELYAYYTSINYHPSKSRKYERIMNDAQTLYNRELESHRCFCELRLAMGNARGSLKEKSLPKAIEFCNRLSKQLESSNTSYYFQFYTYSVIAMRYELAHNHRQLLEISNQAVKSLQGRKVNRKAGIFQFEVLKIICFIQLQQYEKVEAIANIYFGQMTKSAINWFVLKIYVLVSRLHYCNYQGAYDIIQEVRSDKNYAKLPENLLQTWFVYEAHIEFLVSIGKASSTDSKRFRLYKFLNDIPIYSKDKRGLNIAILIVHTIILLQKRKYGQIIDRVDALNQYCHRHLRRDDTFRSSCFIKMLLQIPKADFNRQRAERYAQPYLTKLSSMPLMISDQSIEVEIIPYQNLWDMVLDLLG